MRFVVMALMATLALAWFTGSAVAAPSLPHKADAVSAMTPVRDGCGGGWHAATWRDRWGNVHRKCVPNRG